MGLLDELKARASGLGKEVADSGHAALYLRQLLRGNHAPRGGVPDTCAGPPVLLIHGYLATRGSMHLLEQRLNARGHVVMTYRLGSMNLGDIRSSAGLLARKVESLVLQTGVERVDLVGHSMGGLVCLYYLKRLGGARRVRRLIMLGTPVRGTWSAVLALGMVPFGRASLQLLPGSPFLRELTEGGAPPDVEVVSVAGDRDWFAPVRSTALQGVRHLALPTGHSGLVVDEDVADAVDDLLRASSITSS